MKVSVQIAPASGGVASIPVLFRREVCRFASWWADFALMGIIAATTWTLVARGFVANTLTDSLGAITATSIGLCIGASLPLIARLFGAWRFCHRLDLRHGGEPTAGLRSQFLAASLQQSGSSAMRCSGEDLRRTVTVAASAAAKAARSAAMPATVAAFITPAVALIGGLDMASRTVASSPMAVMTPSMIAGIMSGLFVVVLAEAFTVVVRNSVERWGAGVELDELARLAGRPISRVVSPMSEDDDGVNNLNASSSSTVAADDFEQTLKKLTQSG